MAKTSLMIFLLEFAAFLLLQGCQLSNNPAAYPGADAYPSDLISPPTLTVAPNKSAVVGRVVRISGNQRKALRNTSILFAKTQWNEQKNEGIFVLDTANSPGTLTRSDGSFMINNIEPGTYVIIVGDAIGVHTVISEPDGRAKVYTIEPNQILDIGIIEVDWGDTSSSLTYSVWRLSGTAHKFQHNAPPPARL